MTDPRAFASADRILWATGWRSQEESALRQLAGTRGLVCAPLEPYSDLIQLVAYDGEHLGHVRLDGLRGLRERWVAVSKAAPDAQPDGGHATARDAARAPAHAAGKAITDTE
jgi:hypothetical protein